MVERPVLLHHEDDVLDVGELARLYACFGETRRETAEQRIEGHARTERGRAGEDLTASRTRLPR